MLTHTRAAAAPRRAAQPTAATCCARADPCACKLTELTWINARFGQIVTSELFKQKDKSCSIFWCW
jgi:hypothetical protein